MPKNLASTGLTFPEQRAPLSGEDRAAGPMESFFQDSADRSAYLRRRIDSLHVDGEGVHSLRRVESITVLKALTDHPDGTVCMVGDLGIYSYSAESMVEERGMVVIRPTAIAPAEPGRWTVLTVGRGLINVPYGVPGLDENGKVPTSRLEAAEGGERILGKYIKAGLVDFQTAFYAGPSASNATETWLDLASPSFVVPAKNGDKLKVTAGFAATNDANDDLHLAKVMLVTVSPSAAVRMIPGAFYQGPKTKYGVLLYGFAPISEDGDWQVKLQYCVGATVTGNASVSQVTMCAELRRP